MVGGRRVGAQRVPATQHAYGPGRMLRVTLPPPVPQVDQRVFRDLMSEKLPRLHTHLEQYSVDYTLITFNWFLVVFVDSVVSDILFKIWDSFLYEGPKVGPPTGPPSSTGAAAGDA